MRLVIDNSEEIQFLLDIGVTQEGICTLSHNVSPEQVRQDLTYLKSIYNHLPESPEEIHKIINSFSTWLWTVLGEISIPETLGTYIPSPWPVLIYPFALQDVFRIKDFVLAEGCYISKTEEIWITPLLHACLYGGQPWYPSLREVYLKVFGPEPKKVPLLWLDSTTESRCTLAALGRKLQLQLRPSLVALEIQVPGKIYPGIQRAFHTPNLGNVAIHKLILEKECWR